MTMTANDGTRVQATFTLSRLLRASDADAAWRTVGGSDSPPCQVDESRTGFFVGTLAFTNETPNFQPKVLLALRENINISAGNYDVGIGYDSDPTCIDVNSDLEPWIRPNMSNGPNWGPVPFEIVVKNYFSPDSPDGRPLLLNGGLQFTCNVSAGALYNSQDA